MSTPQRPNFIDLRMPSQMSVPRPMKSPRLHVAGEVPPELSPLDAFALQSRLLAKQLEESKRANRASRLPPLTTDSPLIKQGRSEFFRSLSQDSISDPENMASPPRLPAGQPTSASHSDASPLSQKPSPTQPQPLPPLQPQSLTPTGFGMKTPEVEEPALRPRSMHPRMSHVPPTPDDSMPPPIPDYARGRQMLLQKDEPKAAQNESMEGPGLFGARRERSPSPVAEDVCEGEQLLSAAVSGLALSTSPADSQAALVPPPPRSPGLPQQQQHYVAYSQPASPSFQPPSYPYLAAHSTSNLSLAPAQSPERGSANRSPFEPLASGGLAPPRTLFPKRSSSIMSTPLELMDEDRHSIVGSSFYSQPPRKLSTSSGMSGMPSPGFGSFHRSPSMCSDMSAPLPRPSFNFSRPLSRAGTPGLESLVRQASSDSHTSYSRSSFYLADESANTPVSMTSEGFPDSTAAENQPGSSATASNAYSRYSLPRGKMLQRSSPQLNDPPLEAPFQWEQPAVQPQALPLGGQAPPSPPMRPSSSAGVLQRPSTERSKLGTEVLTPTEQPSPNPSRPSTDGGRSSSDDAPRGRVSALQQQEASSISRGKTPLSIAASASDSASTIKARSVHSLATASEIPAEEHVEKAIALHEQGELNESTYHLRHAALQGHPTGMLLYALACRHGWGMRANPSEGAQWLRKAADCASLEIADDEEKAKEGKTVDVVGRRTRKAQFALSIYELGVSYMNGWGIEQDKALALRCFEIAGSWGDVDAMAEAGYCYAKGVGCKKNLKKSAQFYREAEGKGMNMVGNSWIHKSKYDEDLSDKNAKEKKARSKSRSRHLFGKKHNSP